MDISDLRLVETIIKTGSLSEASRILNQSQPTLSRRLARLEDQLSVSLFHRSTKGLSPSDIANYLVSQTTAIDNQIGAIQRYVELATRLEVGTIRVGVGPIIEHLLLPDVLTKFAEETGGVEVVIVTEDDSGLIKMFETSQLDVIIGPIHSEHGENRGWITKPMIGDKIIAVARESHPVFEAAKIDYSELGKHEWVIPKTTGSITVEPGRPDLENIKVRSDNYSLLKNLTARLDLICAGPRSIFRDELKSGSLKELDIDLGIFWQSSLFVRPETISTPLVARFIEMCEEALS